MELNATRTYQAESLLWGATLDFSVNGSSKYDDDTWTEVAKSELAEMTKEEHGWFIVDHYQEEIDN